MSKNVVVKRIIYIILIIFWMNVIFSFSSDVGEISGGKSKIITEKVVEVIEAISDNIEVDESYIHFLVRKTGHVVVYFILTILIMGFLFTIEVGVKYKYMITWFSSTVYAGLDEYHQTFVEGRGGRVVDVFIDNIGIIGAILVTMIIREIIRRKKK